MASISKLGGAVPAVGIAVAAGDGTFVDRESLLAGPGGFLKILSTWKMTQSGSSLTTVIPFGGP